MSESTKTKSKAKAKGRKKAASPDGKMSCIDAAAKVLVEKGEPMNGGGKEKRGPLGSWAHTKPCRKRLSRKIHGKV